MKRQRRRGDPYQRYVEDDRGHGTACWIWQGALNVGKSGKGLAYGRMYDGEKLAYSHRAFYERHIGPIPDGLVIDHLCRVPACVNPEHLEAVTYAENNRRVEYEYPSRSDLTGHQRRVLDAYEALPLGPKGMRPKHSALHEMLADLGISHSQLTHILKVAGRLGKRRPTASVQ